MKGPYPSQKCHVLQKFKLARSRQGWQSLNILLILPSAEIRSRGSSRQTFGATELGSPIISTSRSLMSIANMAPTCQESGLTQGQSIPASSSLPSLMPPFASPSSFFPSSDPSWCFSFFLFFSSPTKEGPPLNMDAIGVEFGKTWEQSLKRFLVVCLLFLFCFVFFFYCFCNSFSIQACLSPSLYAVIPLYINKNHHCFISYILSLLFEMVMS